MKSRKNRQKEYENSQAGFSSMANWLTKRLDEGRRYYDVLRASYLLRETDPSINPEAVQDKMRLLQITLEHLSQEFDEAMKHSQYFPEIKNQFLSAGINCRILAAEIDDYLLPI
jgi:hypothetical protein